MRFSAPLAGLALSLILVAPALAQNLAGPPEPQRDGDPRMWAPQGADPGEPGFEHHGHRNGGAHEKACYAQVRTPAVFGPPPTGPEYVWRQAPAPPGAPGPVWCLTVQPFPAGPVMTAPARLGWIRVLCADDATPERVFQLQRRLHARGLYRGEIDGRYDERTAGAVIAFQRERHISHHGYLSYETLQALEGPPPPPRWALYGRAPTTFERGYLTWPGKTNYW